MVVVLPAPLGPRKPWTSPAVTPSSKPSSARTGPNVLTSPLIAMASLVSLTVRGCRVRPPTVAHPLVDERDADHQRRGGGHRPGVPRRGGAAGRRRQRRRVPLRL